MRAHSITAKAPSDSVLDNQYTFVQTGLIGSGWSIRDVKRGKEMRG